MGSWPVGYLHNAVEELNPELPRINPGSSRVKDLNQGPPDFKSSALNHSATLPPFLFVSAFFLFSMFCCIYLLVAYFMILSRINILIYCLFTRSSIAVGPRFDALKPLVKFIPYLLAVSKAPSTVKGCHSQFQKWKAWAASFPGVTFISCFCSSYSTLSY